MSYLGQFMAEMNSPLFGLKFCVAKPLDLGDFVTENGAGDEIRTRMSKTVAWKATALPLSDPRINLVPPHGLEPR